MTQPSSSVFPWSLTEDLVANGDLPNSEVAILIEEAIRALAGGERELPTVMIGEQDDFQLITPAGFERFHFRLKPYASAVILELLIDAQTSRSQAEITISTSVGATLIEKTRTFEATEADDLDRMGFLSLSFDRVAGSDSGKLAAGDQVCTVIIQNPDAVNVAIWAVNVTMLHTPLLQS